MILPKTKELSWSDLCDSATDLGQTQSFCASKMKIDLDKKVAKVIPMDDSYGKIEIPDGWRGYWAKDVLKYTEKIGK